VIGDNDDADLLTCFKTVHNYVDVDRTLFLSLLQAIVLLEVIL